MPNWCFNTLAVTGKPADIEAFRMAAAGTPARFPDSHFPEEEEATSVEIPLCFHALHPIPPEVLAGGFDHKTAAENGAPVCGYDWCINAWGTKWDLDGSTHVIVHDTSLRYVFDTAWDPPLALCRKIAADYPDLRFRLKWSEPGNDNCGSAVFADGKLRRRCQSSCPEEEFEDD